MSFTSWIDQQIIEAEKRGVFDNLPGAGKPIPDRGEADYGQAWLRDYLRREGVSAEEFLPTPLKLRKEIERLTEDVQNLHSEQEVRDTVEDLNRRIMDWRRTSLGPPIFVPLVNKEVMVGKWRGEQSVKPPASSPADVDRETRDIAPPQTGWWRRLSRLGRHLLPAGAWSRRIRHPHSQAAAGLPEPCAAMSGTHGAVGGALAFASAE
ncbi:MAG TPA: DUF1992 domain-containing protein [Streptosporangiaceae bacterium]|jgi:hypothetical protein|nr:DUF1992 domain-containing protein [Streptosporangiaceae bacterium]